MVPSEVLAAIAPTDRVMFTKHPLDADRLFSERYAQRPNNKPKGVWYSLGTQWLDWNTGDSCGECKNGGLAYNLAYRLVLREDRIVRLATVQQIREFTGSVLGKSRNPDEWRNDWPAAALLASGIELCFFPDRDMMTTSDNYHIFSWVSACDCASGCIWSPDAIVSAEEVRAQ